MSLPISKLLLAVGLVLATGAAADAPCWECRAAACYSSFRQTTDVAWREADAEAMARWDAIKARADSLDAANAEHDAVVATLEEDRDARIAVAYDRLLACLQP